MKKSLLFLLSLSLCLATITACSDEGDSRNGSIVSGSPAGVSSDGSTSSSTPLPGSESIEFDLEANNGVDLSNIPDYSSQALDEDEPTYIEKDGYLWLLDPNTFEIIDGPFDIETEERVVDTSIPIPVIAENTPTAVLSEDENIPQSTSDSVEDSQNTADEDSQNYTPSQEKPTEGTKYPNTGIFLEDD